MVGKEYAIGEKNLYMVMPASATDIFGVVVLFFFVFCHVFVLGCAYAQSVEVLVRVTNESNSVFNFVILFEVLTECAHLQHVLDAKRLVELNYF